MSLFSVKSETALRSRLFSSSRSFRRFTCSVFSPPNSWRHRYYVTSLTPIWRIASAMGCPCETRTSTCRSFATISSGLYQKTYLKSDHFNGGWITCAIGIESKSCSVRRKVPLLIPGGPGSAIAAHGSDEQMFGVK